MISTNEDRYDKSYTAAGLAATLSETSIKASATPAPGPFNKGQQHQTTSDSSTTTQRPSSNLNVDAIHDQLLPSDISPAQLYLTDSGLLYHAGKICIVMVGLPARGKTHHAVSLTRYLRWLGVKTHAFHQGDYRRRLCGVDFKVPDDYFQINPSPETKKLRQRVVESCLDDVFSFLNDGGQVAIYDAVNATSEARRKVKGLFEEKGVGVLFVECISTDDHLVAHNVRDVKLSSPDFQGYDYQDAVRSYLRRIELRIPHYETINEQELSYIKLINVSERFILNRAPLGYLQNRIVFFLMNIHVKSGCVYFARAGSGEKSAELQYRNDEPLSKNGHEYARKLRDTLLAHVEERHAMMQSGPSTGTAQPSTPAQESADIDVSTREESEDSRMVSGESIESRLAKAKQSQPADQAQWTTPTPTTSSAWTSSRFTEDSPPQLVVWSSKRVRTFQTANYLSENGVQVTQRTQLIQLNPGVVEGLTDDEIKAKFPAEFEEHQKNTYHHRYPRGESYHDLAVRMEPLIMEIERCRGDLLIIAHESVLRVLYGYLMACTVGDIPRLKFPKNEIVEIVPNAYYNIANRIPIPGVDP